MRPVENDITLPDGLKLNPVEPDFLNQVWPVPMLDSSMGSLLLVGTIFIGALIACVVLFFIGRAFDGWKGALFSGTFLLAGLFVGFTAFVSIQHWNAPNSVNEQSLAVAKDTTYNWLRGNRVPVTERQALDLVCAYYEAKSPFCTGATPVDQDERPLKMHKGNDNTMVLLDDKNQIPIIGETSL